LKHVADTDFDVGEELLFLLSVFVRIAFPDIFFFFFENLGIPCFLVCLLDELVFAFLGVRAPPFFGRTERVLSSMNVFPVRLRRVFRLPTAGARSLSRPFFSLPPQAAPQLRARTFPLINRRWKNGEFFVWPPRVRVIKPGTGIGSLAVVQ